MTINNYPLYVSFGDFQPFSRSLWILYRTLEDLEQNQNAALQVKQKLREEIWHTTFDLYDECNKWNISINEFMFLVDQIISKNQTVNPIPFDWDRHAYENHISNCFILNHEIYE